MRSRNRDRSEVIAFWGFVSPWFVGFVLFSALPLVACLVMSLANFNLYDLKNFHWPGLTHYRLALEDPEARVLIHCQAGRRRSVMVAYAVLRLRGHGEADAERLILEHRTEAHLVPAYRDSVERWLAAAREDERFPGRPAVAR